MGVRVTVHPGTPWKKVSTLTQDGPFDPETSDYRTNRHKTACTSSYAIVFLLPCSPFIVTNHGFEHETCHYYQWKMFCSYSHEQKMALNVLIKDFVVVNVTNRKTWGNFQETFIDKLPWQTSILSGVYSPAESQEGGDSELNITSRWSINLSTKQQSNLIQPILEVSWSCNFCITTRRGERRYKELL